MYSPTYLELKTQLEAELDLQDETFITPNEMLGYFNEGVDIVESAIHSIYEDYFLTSASVSLVSGTAAYALPADIFAQKIRGIFYNDGSSKIYEIKRIRKLAEINTSNGFLGANYYQYMITNDATVGLRVQMFPTPAETSSNVTMYYIRNASRFAVDADICDIPEFTSVVMQYVRWKCHDKEGHPNTDADLRALKEMRAEMVETLTARVPDEDNKIPLDLSFYSDFDTYEGDF